MGSVVVVVDVPNFKGLCALLLRGPYPGIPELFGRYPVVALNLAVVAWCVRRDPLVPGIEEGSGEGVSAVTKAVVRHYPFDAGDSVSGEPRSYPVQERDRCRCLLVRQGFGVGKSAESVDG
jgi:hypothetical protein